MKKSLLSIALMLSAIITQATVLVYEGFNPADYCNVAASKNVGAHEGKTTGLYTKGLTLTSWNRMNGTQIRVFGEDKGLQLPEYMVAKGYESQGGSIGLNPSSNSSDLRSMYHTLETDVLKVADGKLYIRMLLNIDKNAASKLKQQSGITQASGSYFACGFTQPDSEDYYMLTSKASAIAFVIWKNTNGELVLSISVNDGAKNRTSAPIITGIELGATYICFAEIDVNAGTDSKEIINAGAYNLDSTQDYLFYQVTGLESQFISDTYAPKVLAVAGSYGTNNGYFRADEIVVGTEKKDIFPTEGALGVAIEEQLELGLTNYSAAYRIIAEEGVKADVYAVYSTDESFENATTNTIALASIAGKYDVEISNLEMNTTYYLKLVADIGSKVDESDVVSFTTRGLPVIGKVMGSVSSNSFNLSVELLEAAVGNTADTKVSLFLKDKSQDEWVEYQIGTTAEPMTFEYAVEALDFFATYEWYVLATEISEEEVAFSTQTSTKTFMVMWDKDIYVNAETTNPVVPYSTPETAAKNISTVLKYAADGAKIHVESGVYIISSPLNVTNAVQIFGTTGVPCDVVVSNKSDVNWNNKNYRVFILDNKDASVSNLTMLNGRSYLSGGNLYIGTAGGTVSNCVISSGWNHSQSLSGASAGAGLDGGLITHSILRKNSSSVSCGKDKQVVGVLHLKGSSRVENCLIEENHMSQALPLVKVEGSSIFRNNTIVNNSLSMTNGYWSSWSALHIGSGTIVENNIIAATTNKVDGGSAKVTGTRAAFMNGAVDYQLEEGTLPEGTIVGTPEEFFTDYAAGNYRPKTGGVLINKGVNYEGMPLYDLSGTKLRLIDSRVDIGCYEGYATGTLFIIK